MSYGHSRFKTKTLWLCLALILLSIPLLGEAQSGEKRYRSHISNGGITYFFCPKHVGNNVNIKKFTYDMTYNTKGDSVRLNFSVIVPKPIRVSKLTLQCGTNQKCDGDYIYTLYGDLKGKKYEIRTTSMFSLSDIYRMFSQSDVLRFNLSFDDGKVGSAMYGKSEWKKESKQISRIINLINYQK